MIWWKNLLIFLCFLDWKQVILTYSISLEFSCFNRLRFWHNRWISIIRFVLKVFLWFYNCLFVLNIKRIKFYGIVLLCNFEVLLNFREIKVSKKFINLSCLWFDDITSLSSFFYYLIVSIIELKFSILIRNLILENTF